MKFDLNLLRLLVALDQTRHAGRAAEQLQMSPSGFSTALARLRQQVGDELFVRSATGMEPTSRALAMIETAREVLKQVEENLLGAPSFEPATAEEMFRLSMSDVAEAVFLPVLVPHLIRHAPYVSVQVVSPSAKPLAERLSSAQVDLAIGYFPELERDSFYRQALYNHTYACVVRQGHPMAAGGMTRVAYESLGHAVVATPTKSNALLEQALERQGVRRKIVLATPNHLSLPGTITRTDLVATVPLGTAVEFARSGELAVLPLPFPPPVFTTSQYWHARTQTEPRYQWLRAEMRTLFGPATDPYASHWQALYGRHEGNGTSSVMA